MSRRAPKTIGERMQAFLLCRLFLGLGGLGDCRRECVDDRGR
jgi:hypothetical protein